MSSYASSPTRSPRPTPPPASRPKHTGTEQRAARVRFRRALALMAMTLVAPGSAQLLAGTARGARVGRAVLRGWCVLLAVLAVVLLLAVVHRPFAFWLVTSTTVLLWVYLGLVAAALGWAALLVDAWRLGQPLSYALAQRRLSVGVNGLLCFAVAGTLLFGAHIAGVQRAFLLSLFGDGAVSEAAHGRYNVLLMGGDAGAGRWGLRPDSMTVASIDAETGQTVLIALPRNMQDFPFAEGSVMAEQFPDGFDCDGCMLNGVSTWAGDNPELFGDSEQPGVDATLSAVEGITGLDVSYWAMVNLDGFKDLVDAVGGVTLNVRQPIPIGLPGDAVTGTIEPGVRHLDGFETLWFARARYGSDDYSRMARQKCVMNALLAQVSPQNALRHFEAIAQASSDMVATDLPASEVDRFFDLALKAKGQKISTLSLVPPLVNTAAPDIDLIQRKVAEAIGQVVAEPRDDSAPRPRHRKRDVEPQAVTGGSVGSMKSGYAANESGDLNAVC